MNKIKIYILMIAIVTCIGLSALGINLIIMQNSLGSISNKINHIEQNVSVIEHSIDKMKFNMIKLNFNKMYENLKNKIVLIRASSPGILSNYRQVGIGSGIIISPDGYIITNNHVIEGAINVSVYLANRESFDAKIIGIDEKTDLALLKIETDRELPFITLGDSDSAIIGEWTVAIGHPFGQLYSMTVGIISGLHRNLGRVPYEDYIQIDTSINPGNSGGPLFNLKGEIIGINTLIMTEHESSSVGVNFSIPINLIKYVAKELKDHGRVYRGKIGIIAKNVDNEIKKIYNLKLAKGVLVTVVRKGLPASKAGIKTNDILIKYDGKEIENLNRFIFMISMTPLDKEVSIELIRQGKKITSTFKLKALAQDQLTTSIEIYRKYGFYVKAVNDELSIKLSNLNNKKIVSGVIISEIKPHGVADKSGLKINDYLMMINNATVSDDIEKYNQTLLDECGHGGMVTFTILRNGEEKKIMLNPGK
jgi:serine protease Do